MTVFVLKIIAVTTMLIDHIGAGILMRHPEVSWEIYDITRNIGRVAFPIFAYLIANGCKHTKDINKYLVRLGLLAVISEVPFDIAFWGGLERGVSFINTTNVFYTLFLGVLAIVIYEGLKTSKHQLLVLAALLLIPIALVVDIVTFDFSGNLLVRRIPIILALLCVVSLFCLAKFLPKTAQIDDAPIYRKIIAALAVLPLLLISETFGTDYAAFGVGLIFVLYLVNPASKLKRTIALAAGVYYFYGGRIFSRFSNEIDGEWVTWREFNASGFLTFAFAMVSVVFVLLYNGKLGYNSKVVQWGFYLFYPVHIALIAVAAAVVL